MAVFNNLILATLLVASQSWLVEMSSDPYEVITELYNVTDRLDDASVTSLVMSLLSKVECEAHTACGCVTAQDLYTITGTATTGLDLSNIRPASVVLLYFLSDIEGHCNTNKTLEDYSFYRQATVSLADGSRTLDAVIEDLLEGLSHGDDHDDHDDDDDDDHDHDHSEEDAHDEDHDDDHTEEDEAHDDHTDDEEDDHTEDDEDHNDVEDHVDDDVDDDHTDDDDHDDHNDGMADDHDDDHDDEDHSECFSARTLLILCNLTAEATSWTGGDVELLATWTVAFLAKGYIYEAECLDAVVYRQDVRSYFGFQGTDVIDVETFESLLERLGIAGEHAPDTEDDMHDDHDHRRKRSTGRADQISRSRSRRQTAMTSLCVGTERLLEFYDVAEDAGISFQQFEALCPAVLEQTLQDACAQEPDVAASSASYNQDDAYLYGFISVTVISLMSLAGLLLVPCLKKAYHGVMTIFMGLAVGSLAADAMLHLLPEVFGLHDHDHGEGHKELSDVKLEDYQTKGLVVLAAMYFFFLLESVMTLVGSGHSHSSHSRPSIHETSCDILETFQNGHTEPLDLAEKKETKSLSEKKKTKCVSLKPVALSILLGDAVHNFADGLAIGAAFTVSLSSGLATSIAVLCHELPHELGDFAVLLNSGLSYKWAALLNLLSAMTAFIGLFTGILISVEENIRVWIFTVTAGLFLYIALTAMVPELIRLVAESERKGCCGRWCLFLLANIGICLGAGLLLMLGLFESYIAV